MNFREWRLCLWNVVVQSTLHNMGYLRAKINGKFGLYVHNKPVNIYMNEPTENAPTL